ncbi:MAG: hypothetical protein E7812_03120 [Phenylobacterium sp.]|nr:MAG: hypothetical protein E7812_03120 [Phenylobacterium sp.]
MRQALVDYLVNAAWQLPLLALGAAILSRAARIGPRQRCWLWSGFLVLALVLPLQLNLVAPKLGAEIAGASLQIAGSAQPRGLDAAPAIVSAEPVLSLGPRAADILAALFAASLALGGGRLLLGLLAARRLVKRARPVELPRSVLAALEAFARRHGVATPPVRASAGVTGPVTVGAFSPVILVPDDLVRQSPEEVKAALLHEAAHIQRGDYGFNLVCELAVLPLAWHPAIYPLKAGVRQARETACDQLAATAMRSPEVYAECLVALARKALPSLGRPGPVLAMFGQGPLERRVQAVLGASPGGRMTPLRNLAAGALVLAAVVAPALLLHVTPSVAQERSVGLTPAAPAPAQAPAHPGDKVTSTSTVVIARPGAHNLPVTVVDGRKVHGYPHRWTAADGQKITVVNDQPGELTPAEQRRIEADIARQMADAQKQVEEAQRQVAAIDQQAIQREVESAQREVEAARQQLATLDMPRMNAEIARAQARLNDPAIQKKIAEAGAQVNGAKMRAAMARADAALKAHHHALILQDQKVIVIRGPDEPQDPSESKAPDADAPK